MVLMAYFLLGFDFSQPTFTLPNAPTHSLTIISVGDVTFTERLPENAVLRLDPVEDQLLLKLH